MCVLNVIWGPAIGITGLAGILKVHSGNFWRIFVFVGGLSRPYVFVRDYGQSR